MYLLEEWLINWIESSCCHCLFCRWARWPVSNKVSSFVQLSCPVQVAGALKLCRIFEGIVYRDLSVIYKNDSVLFCGLLLSDIIDLSNSNNTNTGNASNSTSNSTSQSNSTTIGSVTSSLPPAPDLLLWKNVSFYRSTAMFPAQNATVELIVQDDSKYLLNSSANTLTILSLSKRFSLRLKIADQNQKLKNWHLWQDARKLKASTFATQVRATSPSSTTHKVSWYDWINVQLCRSKVLCVFDSSLAVHLSTRATQDHGLWRIRSWANLRAAFRKLQRPKHHLAMVRQWHTAK